MRTPAALALLLILSACASHPTRPMVEVWARYDGKRISESEESRADFRRSRASCDFEMSKARTNATPSPYRAPDGSGPFTEGTASLIQAMTFGPPPQMFYQCMGSRGYYVEVVMDAETADKQNAECTLRAAEGATTREELAARKRELGCLSPL